MGLFFGVSFCMYLPSSLAILFRPSSSFFLKSVFLLDKEGSSLFKKTKRCLRASDATGPRGWTNRLRLSLADWQQAFGSRCCCSEWNPDSLFLSESWTRFQPFPSNCIGGRLGQLGHSRSAEVKRHPSIPFLSKSWTCLFLVFSFFALSLFHLPKNLLKEKGW